MLVLDCSVAMAWLLPDETSAYADSVLERLKDGYAVAPTLWVQEVANVLLVSVRRGRVSKEDAQAFAGYLEALDIRISDPAPCMADMAWLVEFGDEHGLSAYDASYVLLAIGQDLPLATLDRRLAAVAARLGVLFQP